MALGSPSATCTPSSCSDDPQLATCPCGGLQAAACRQYTRMVRHPRGGSGQVPRYRFVSCCRRLRLELRPSQDDLSVNESPLRSTLHLQHSHVQPPRTLRLHLPRAALLATSGGDPARAALLRPSAAHPAVRRRLQGDAGLAIRGVPRLPLARRGFSGGPHPLSY